MRTLLLAVLSAVLLPAAAAAQSYTPRTITFTGAPAYSSQDLLQATGLTAGKPVSKADIQLALQALDDTGLFANMRYNVSDAALVFTLTPQPDKLMLPANYTNFIVLDTDKITSLVHARVPLFTGKVPNVGNLQQAVQDALTAILKEKGIAAHVDAIQNHDRHGETMAFSIADPPVHMRSLKVDAVSPAAQAEIAKIAATYAGKDFDLSSGPYIQGRLADAYRDLGFLDIAIDPVAYGAPVVTPAAILTDVTTTAREGRLYHLTRFEFPASPIVPAGDFANDAQIKPGGAASRVLLLSTTARVDGEFQKRGYLDAKVTLTEHKDAAAHTIGYTYAAEPGEQYHLEAVHTEGFTPQQQKEFDSRWKMKPGAPYDGEYAEFFMDRNAALFQGYTSKARLEPNRAAHTVIVTYTVTRR
ncbi:outer membrane protein insertion porin family [Granulicella rosea]|uniref:Outer membrane protein insertion porin family n=1 Tax=Granulicella rosea TaxID=474952 RepID=A0A239E0E1_9BACT|nr:hypothetical protein [Granulicella rosea]SNS37442.1 outer membrane protein insertion porin family [Granulicella rosea]